MKFGPMLLASAFTALAGILGAGAAEPAVRNVVLVHGAFADGSGWKAVATILQNDGFTVGVVQEPETSLPDDVAAAHLVIDRMKGPVVLVGHSYGGAVITVAGNDPRVTRLVYLAGFAPDEGQTLKALNESKPAIAKPFVKTIDGFDFVEEARFPEEFAAGVPLLEARFMAISQVGEAVGTGLVRFPAPAWKTRPAWAVVATEDHMIDPDLEREMYTRAHARITEVKSSHAVYITQPQACAKVIEEAAAALP